MLNKLTSDEAKEKNLKTLELYVPIVSRVHGASHPEFYEVHKLYDTIIAKMEETGSNEPELNEEFIALRKVTNDYTIPGDVCESYEAVYNMLAEIDKAYNA